MYVLGIDPGPLVGVCLLELPAPGGREWHAQVAQVAPAELWPLIAAWAEAHPIAAVAAERFVVRQRAGRVSDPGASKAARDVLGGLAVALPDTRRIERSAAEVKPWATDARLEAAGLLGQTRGMPHARDASRHALFAACRDFGARIPRTGANA